MNPEEKWSGLGRTLTTLRGPSSRVNGPRSERLFL